MLRCLRQRPWLQGMDAACQNQLLCVGQLAGALVFFPPPHFSLPSTHTLSCLALDPIHLSTAGWLKTSTAGRKLVVGAGLISGNVTANGAKKGRCVLESIPRGTALVCQSRDITVKTKA